MNTTLSTIQNQIHVPKGQFNAFGKYRYRSCEDIVEAVKPVLNAYGYYLTLSDEVILIGNRVYIKATATISDGNNIYTSSAFAREEETKKGMDAAQITGSTSSYARKYALNGLFAIDDTKDSDATNKHESVVSKEEITDVPTEVERQILRGLVFTSTLSDQQKESALSSIEKCPDFKTYQDIQFKLEARQTPLDQIQNPSQKDINKHLKKIK